MGKTLSVAIVKVLLEDLADDLHFQEVLISLPSAERQALVDRWLRKVRETIARTPTTVP